MPCRMDLPHQPPFNRSILPHQEEAGPHIVFRQQLQQLRSAGGIRSIIKGQRNLDHVVPGQRRRDQGIPKESRPRPHRRVSAPARQQRRPRGNSKPDLDSALQSLASTTAFPNALSSHSPSLTLLPLKSPTSHAGSQTQTAQPAHASNRPSPPPVLISLTANGTKRHRVLPPR